MAHSCRELTHAEQLAPQLCWLDGGLEDGGSCGNQVTRPRFRNLVVRGVEKALRADPARGRDLGAGRGAVLAFATTFLAILIVTRLLGFCSKPEPNQEFSAVLCEASEFQKAVLGAGGNLWSEMLGSPPTLTWSGPAPVCSLWSYAMGNCRSVSAPLRNQIR